MNKKKKDFMSQLSNLDTFSVEEIAEKYPALNENIKKRILNKCINKDGFSAETDYNDEDELIVLRNESYNHSSWYKFGAFAAAFVIAAVGITSVFMLNRNHNENDHFEIAKAPAVYTYDPENDSNPEQNTFTTSNRGYHTKNNEYSETTVSGTAQTPTTVIETTGKTENDSPDNNFGNSESENTSGATPSQNAFINPDGFYYVKATGEDEGLIMGFSFAQDGSLTKYVFDDYGAAINNTMVHTYYEVAGNRFSYVLPSGDTRNGTIVNSNGTNSFSVQFDDGQLCDFSTERPIFKTTNNVQEKNLTLNGTTWGWYSDDHSENRHIEFNEDGVSGHYICYTETTDATIVPFTYEKNGDECTLYLPGYGENLILKVRLLDSESTNPTLAVEYIGEGTIYFYLISTGTCIESSLGQ